MTDTYRLSLTSIIWKMKWWSHIFCVSLICKQSFSFRTEQSCAKHHLNLLSGIYKKTILQFYIFYILYFHTPLLALFIMLSDQLKSPVHQNSSFSPAAYVETLFGFWVLSLGGRLQRDLLAFMKHQHKIWVFFEVRWPKPSPAFAHMSFSKPNTSFTS